MPKGYTCYCCGASGEENFTNTRDELLDEIDDDYFDYEKPLDFVTAAERKRLMKEAGGDEAKANALLTQGRKALMEEQEQEEGEKDGEGGEDKKKKKKKNKKKSSKKKKKEDVQEEIQAKGDDGNVKDDGAMKIGDALKKDDTPTPKRSASKSNDDKDDDDDLSILGMD
jgi:hypothetical protein